MSERVRVCQGGIGSVREGRGVCREGQVCQGGMGCQERLRIVKEGRECQRRSMSILGVGVSDNVKES